MCRSLLVMLMCMVLLGGCGQRTTLVLLPNSSGETGQAVLKAKEGEITVHEPYSSSVVSAGGVLPSVPRVLSAEKVGLRYGKLLAAQPSSPVSYVLYFRSGSTELTPESQLVLSRVHESIPQNVPYEISIIGHTDAVGGKEDNLRLSLQRANMVKKLLTRYDSSFYAITVQSYGENDPLIPTPDNVAEPKNRRVEIMIR